MYIYSTPCHAKAGEGFKDPPKYSQKGASLSEPQNPRSQLDIKKKQSIRQPSTFKIQLLKASRSIPNQPLFDLGLVVLAATIAGFAVFMVAGVPAALTDPGVLR